MDSKPSAKKLTSNHSKQDFATSVLDKSQWNYIEQLQKIKKLKSEQRPLIVDES
jgi:hypothetical protein